MNQLVKKGHKTVAQYMKRAGYQLYDCIETENGYEAEYYKTAAGITVNTVIVKFNNNWRCTEVH